jgi:hypothetical protein
LHNGAWGSILQRERNLLQTNQGVMVASRYLNHGQVILRAMKLSRVVIVMLAFTVALFITTGFLIYEVRQNIAWKMQVENLANYEGKTRARRDFEAGKLRLFVIAGERNDDKFSGTNDGPFEIWYPQYYPDFYPFRFSTEQMITAYNEKMRYFHEHPGKSLVATNATTR